MDFSSALQSVITVYRSRTDELLPVYFLSPGVSQASRAVLLVGLAVAYAYLEVTGRLAGLRGDLRAAETGPPGPGADVDAVQRWFEAVAPAFEQLVTPELVAILGASLLATLVVFALLSAVTSAAQLSCCRATLHDEWGTEAAIAGARRHWTSILGLSVLEFAVVVVLTAIAVAPLVVLADSPLALVVVGVAAGLLWLVAFVVVSVVFAFAAVAVVVDGTGVRGGLAGAGGFIRTNPLWAVGYAAAVVGVLGVVSAASATAGAASGVASALLGFVVTAPVLDLLKTALYSHHAGGIDPPEPPEATAVQQLTGGVRRGVDAMRTFVRRNPGPNALAAVLFVGGAYGGWALAGSYEGLVTASIDARLEDHVPATAAVAFATNNTTVAISSATSGLAAGVPSVVSLLFNGALFGVLGRVEAAPLQLVAFVVPHGIIEIPALVIAGALGLSLGGTGLRALGGGLSRAEFAEALERAFRILVGVATLLAIAAVIEGFVSPYYYRPFLAL